MNQPDFDKLLADHIARPGPSHTSNPNPPETWHLRPLKVVAFLQCLWVNDPGRVKPMLDDHERRYPDTGRERMLYRLLFHGGKTGTMLEDHLGEKWCQAITWEEITREVGSHSSAKFPPQFHHIEAVLAKHQPTVVVAFGIPAKQALQRVHGLLPAPKAWNLVAAPHPAARGESTAWALQSLRKHLDALAALYDNTTTTNHDHELRPDKPVRPLPL
jgi:hypothetical protein